MTQRKWSVAYFPPHTAMINYKFDRQGAFLINGNIDTLPLHRRLHPYYNTQGIFEVLFLSSDGSGGGDIFQL